MKWPINQVYGSVSFQSQSKTILRGLNPSKAKRDAYYVKLENKTRRRRVVGKN